MRYPALCWIPLRLLPLSLPTVMPSSSILRSPSHNPPSRIRHPIYPSSSRRWIRVRRDMSSITPASFVDDGSSFEKRILHPLHDPKWFKTSGSDTTSAYTGSYIDDGADMLLPSRYAPGFGAINPNFYKQRKRKENEKQVWNEDIQKAVAGDIGRSLEKMRSIGGLEVKRPTGDRKEKREKKRKDTITITLPRKWGTFVIKANDGRVIVVDEDGEFDSGPQLQQQTMKWVKAPTIASLPSSSPRNEKKKSKHLEPFKTLTPIPESEYEDGYVPSGSEDVKSPTGFFMTGGKNGWPSRSVSPVQSRRNSRQSSLLKPTSPVRSPPGSWPSPPQSPTKVLEAPTSSAKSQGKARPRSSKKPHRSSRYGNDDVSTESHSTYKPATVEDAPDTLSENESLVKGGWGGSQKSQADEWNAKDKDSENGWGGKKTSDQSWGGSNKSSHKSSRHNTGVANNDTWAAQPPANAHAAPSIIQNWVGDRVKTVSEASEHKSRFDRKKSHSRSHSRAHSEATWDGYEKPKTMSEVSVAGTSSERSWPRASSHRSHRSNRTDNWGGGQGANVDGWGGDRTGSDSGSSGGKSRYSNGYNEDDGMYLNESWGGVKVRVRSRRGSMNASGIGWDE